MGVDCNSSAYTRDSHASSSVQDANRQPANIPKKKIRIGGNPRDNVPFHSRSARFVIVPLAGIYDRDNDTFPTRFPPENNARIYTYICLPIPRGKLVGVSLRRCHLVRILQTVDVSAFTRD